MSEKPIYYGFRVTGSLPAPPIPGYPSAIRVPNFYKPGARSSQSPLRWVSYSGAPPKPLEYEIFADIFLEGSAGSGGLLRYRVKYWYVRVDTRVRQGTLPVAGSPKVQIPSTSFQTLGDGIRYYFGGPSSSSTPPTLSVALQETFTTYDSPFKMFGYVNNTPVSGPGGQFIKGSPGTNEPDNGPNAPDDPGNDKDKEEPDVPSVRLKNYKTYWNPPLIRYASGAYVPYDTDPRSEATKGDPMGGVTEEPTKTRQSLLGIGTYNKRIGRKGWIVQDTTWSRDWSTREDADIKSEDQSKKTWEKDSLILEDKKRYGFRFLYNPGELSFSMGQYMAVNPAVILTRKKQVTPITDPENPPSISLNLLLNRTEDMGLISRKRTKTGWSYSVDEGLNPYGKGNWEEHIEGIATRGTMWDLEYLFRTCLGRPMPTDLRGTTADLGIFFGVPLIVNLSDRMRYRCRMNSIAYAHTSFTVDMIPILTSVTLNMTRLPDGTSFKPGKAPKDGKK